MTFLDLLGQTIKVNNSLVCVGLDTDRDKLPESVRQEQNPVFSFNQAIVDATAQLVAAFKLNIAFYAQDSVQGLQTLKKTIEYIHDEYPALPVILDAKRADIGNTSEGYTKEVFDDLAADAVTVNPYMGHDSLVPFLKRKNKGIIILCRTSNPGASDFQELILGEEPLYMHIARKVIEWDQIYHNCLMVVGATAPQQMAEIRHLTPTMFFLVPGLGAQGGDLEMTLKAGLRSDRSGLIINSSRAIIYASNDADFAGAARQKTIELRESINKIRN